MQRKITFNKEKTVSFLKKQIMLFVLIGLILVFTIFNPTFINPKNLMNILSQNAYLIIATIGVAMIMISGGTDLSVGRAMSVVGICTAIFILQLNIPVWISMLMGIVVCLILGGFNGYISNKLRVHPMIITLASMTIFEGLAYIIGQSKTFIGFPDSYKIIGQKVLFGFLPISVIIMIVVAVVIHFVLKKTYFGRHIYAVGGNPEAARLAGINVGKVKLMVFLIAYLLVGLSALILTSRSVAASAAIGPGTEFTAITACVLGGVSFIGGEGNVKGAVIGVLILGVLSNGMLLAGWGTYYQYIVKGIILISAIGFETYQKYAKAKKVTKVVPEIKA